MSKILITGCTDPMMWYCDMIGQEVELVRDLGEEYLSREPAGYLNIILKKDCEIVRPPKYSTMDLYGTTDLSLLKGETKYIYMRLALLQANLIKENDKHWSIRDSHLITKIADAQNFWRERIKELENVGD